MSSMKFNKGPMLENSEMNINPNFTYNNRLHNSMNIMQGNNTNFNSQEKYYTNLYTTNQNPMYFSFKERNGKLRWKEIMKLDIESMIKTNDISPLETYLENLIFSNVDENDVEIITEATTVKLIKIYQHVLEYLLHTQIRLENENKMLETNYSQILNDTLVKDNTLKENKSTIHSLKKDKKEKEMILNTYKCIIEEYKSSGLPVNIANARSMKLSSLAVPNNYQTMEKRQLFFCPYCSGKKFSTEENLNSHIQRRHANQKKSENFEKLKDKELDISDLRQSKRDYVKTLEGQVEELKLHLQTFMKSNVNSDSLNKLVENQKCLESKFSEFKTDKDKMLNLMQENFKNTLVELKEFVKNNVSQSNSFHQKNEDFQENNQSLINQKEGIETIKNNIHDMNNKISEIKNIQNEKIQSVYEQLNSIKNTISSEIRDLKTNNTGNNTNNNVNNHVNMNTQSFSELRENKFKTESIEITNAFSISNLPEKVKEFKKENNSDKQTNNIKMIKPFFNAGPLESDNSDSEREFDDVENSKRNKIPNNKIKERESANVNALPEQQVKNGANEYKKNHIKNILEEQRIESERKEKAQNEAKNPMKEEANRPKVANNSKEKSPIKTQVFDEVSQDKCVDISDISHNKNQKLKSQEQQSNKNKKLDEHEIIMDDISDNPNNKSNMKNIKELKNTTEPAQKPQEVNKDTSINNNNNNNKNVASNSDDNINFKKDKSRISEAQKNEIQIADLKSNNIKTYNLEEEKNIEDVKSKFVEQFKAREKIFNNAPIDLKNLDIEKDDLDIYKRVL